jgi:hypothetical protein
MTMIRIFIKKNIGSPMGCCRVSSGENPTASAAEYASPRITMLAAE